MLTDYLKPATFLFQNCSMGGKEPNKEEKRIKDREKMQRVLKGNGKCKGRENFENPNIHYAHFFLRASAHANSST